DRWALVRPRRSPALAPWANRLGAARRAYVLQFAALVAAYYAAAHLGYALTFSGPVASFVWLPAGIGIAFLYLLGPRLWPAVVVGDLLVNAYSAGPIGSPGGPTFGNLVEVLVAALLLRSLARRRDPLGSAGGVVEMLIALLVGTALSATVGLGSLLAGHVVELSSVPR